MYANYKNITACHFSTKPESYKPDRKNNELVLIQLLAFIQITVDSFLVFLNISMLVEWDIFLMTDEHVLIECGIL